MTSAAAPTSGTVPVTGGGTGLTSGTSGGIPYFSSSTSMGSSGALTQYGVVYGGGAGGSPATTAAGTTGQVLTAVTGSAPVWASSSSITALSALTSAQAADSFDNAAWAQTWTWNSLSIGTAMTLSSSSMTTGTLLSLQDTAVAATSTGQVLSVSDATTGSGYGVYSSMSGAGNTGYAGYFTNTTSTGAGIGVYGGVAGPANAGYGVYGSNPSASGYAVYASGALAATGTAQAASFIPTGSTVPSNGIYLPAANTLGLATNGAPALTITSSGSVGVSLYGPGLRRPADQRIRGVVVKRCAAYRKAGKWSPKFMKSGRSDLHAIGF